LRRGRNPFRAKRRVRSFRGDPFSDNNLTEICQYG
jgi:hypothetical protein